MNECITAFSAFTLPVFCIRIRNRMYLCLSDVPVIIPPLSSPDRFALSLSNCLIAPLLSLLDQEQRPFFLSVLTPNTPLMSSTSEMIAEALHSLMLSGQKRQHCICYPVEVNMQLPGLVCSSHSTEYAFHSSRPIYNVKFYIF